MHLLERLKEHFEAGHIRIDSNDNTARYVVESKEDLKRIAKFLTHETRLRSKKAREFMIWKRALFINDKDRISQLNDLRKVLRPWPYISKIKLTDQWVLGFIEGDGSFLVAIRLKQLVRDLPYIYCYFNITQKEKEVLEKIQSYLNLGNINTRSKGGYSYDIGINSQLFELITKLNKIQFQSGPKYYDYTIWKIILWMVYKGYHLISVTHQLIVRLSKTMHSYGKSNVK